MFENEHYREPLHYTRLGSEECPVSPEDEDIYYQEVYRIPKLENLGMDHLTLRLESKFVSLKIS